ncbi:MAG TPA: ACP S-malonyltransferase [Nitrospiria bacterium]|nr:ACP S-malonyltransferase [Nitrospiria bacterium]
MTAAQHIAWLFPGQGSQTVGMGKLLHDQCPEARAVYVEASDALGWDVARVSFDGPEAELNRTAVTQPALLTASVAAFRVLARKPIAASFAAGHSLGEYTALVCAGAVPFAQAVRIVHHRGRYMQEAVPEGEGAMAAVLGLDQAGVAAACREASALGVVEPANLNSPGQIVIAGARAAVARAGELAAAAGAKRVVPLPVSVPSHCRLMADAARRLEVDLRHATWSAPRVPVVTNVDAKPLTSTDAIVPALVRQLSSPLLWEDSIRFMLDQGVTTFVEVGPGRVLSGLTKKIERSARALQADTPDTVEAVWAAVETLATEVAQ